MIFKKNEKAIYYESIGSGMPVIMIHGGGPDHRSLKGCMEPCFKGLEDTFRRVYFDLPGFGKSESDSSLTDADKLLEYIIVFIDSLIPNQQFILVGNSYGGYLSRGILKKKQDRVKGLFLYCPSVQNTSPKPAKCVLEKDPELDTILSEEDKSYFEPFVVRQTINVWNRYKEEILPGLKQRGLDSKSIWNKSGKSFNVDDLEYTFDKPVLILAGKQDSMVGYNDSINLLKDFPKATLAVIENAGHALQIEQPVLFTCLTKEWLERIVKNEETSKTQNVNQR